MPANAFTEDEEEEEDETAGAGGQLDQSSSSESDDDGEWAPVSIPKSGQAAQPPQPAPAAVQDDAEDDDDDDGWDAVPMSTAKKDSVAPSGTSSTMPPEEIQKAKDDGYEEIDMAKELQLYRNTEANTGDQTVFSANRIYEADIYNDGLRLPGDDEHPNLVRSEDVEVPMSPSSPTKKQHKARDVLQLQQSPPMYEMNRCTIILEHGDP